jgi:hypothetical protein
LIVIEKVSGGYHARATPPHSRSAWETSRPLSVREISAKLLELGAHQIDIGDAFYEADPSWISD